MNVRKYSKMKAGSKKRQMIRTGTFLFLTPTFHRNFRDNTHWNTYIFQKWKRVLRRDKNRENDILKSRLWRGFAKNYSNLNRKMIVYTHTHWSCIAVTQINMRKYFDPTQWSNKHHTSQIFFIHATIAIFYNLRFISHIKLKWWCTDTDHVSQNQINIRQIFVHTTIAIFYKLKWSYQLKWSHIKLKWS